MFRYLLYGIIIAIHLLMFIVLFMNNPVYKQRGDGEAPPAVQQSDAAGSQSQSAAETNRAPGFPLYSDNYYRNAGLNLDQELLRLSSQCRAAAVIDPERKMLLWGKNVDQPYPLASITKLMTVLLLMDDLRADNNNLSLDTPVKVSLSAAKVSRRLERGVYLDSRETFSIDELLKSVLIRSANDCAYLLAEFLSDGKPEDFVARMNRRGKELGCKNFFFINPHGLPEGSQDNLGSVLEIAYLTEYLWRFPEVMKWTATRRERIRENSKPFDLDSTNALLRTCPGVNGMKTGMTNRAGHCIVVTCEREQKRIMVIVMGVTAVNGAKLRNDLAQRLVEWGYKQSSL
ncbi:MAG: D-alanyl-D-alanine carboxypeptidase [Oligosphaeraceae bacterium]|nr:D-alanyl-D-alanine carboxypeptidase [Oligosphaeraceae bacterium]